MKRNDLPPYIHRRKRDGVLLFRKKYSGRIVEIRLETQFPQGAPIPFALHQERERLLNEPVPVTPGQTLAAVIRHYHASRSYRDLAPRTRQDYDKRTGYLTEKMGKLHPRHIERRHVIAWRDAWPTRTAPTKPTTGCGCCACCWNTPSIWGCSRPGQTPPRASPKSITRSGNASRGPIRWLPPTPTAPASAPSSSFASAPGSGSVTC